MMMASSSTCLLQGRSIFVLSLQGDILQVFLPPRGMRQLRAPDRRDGVCMREIIT